MRLLVLFLCLSSASWAHADALLDQVNTLQGTNSDGNYSHGGTLPLVGPPWPMTHWSPQTAHGGGWWFQSTAKHVNGFRATHQPSPWMGDYGQFVIMPTSGDLKFAPADRESDYDRDASTFRPDYVRIDLPRYQIVAEMTASERCGVFRFTYRQGGTGRLIIDPAKVSHLEISGRTVRGYTTAASGGVPKDWKAYFVIRLDRDLSASGTFNNNVAKPGGVSTAGEHIGAYVEFSLEPGAAVNVAIGTSYISYEQAERNLDVETPGGFDAVRERTAKAWETNLSRLQIKGGTAEQRRTFYSCLYRAQTFPHKLYEFDADGRPIHFSVYDGKLHPGPAYGDIGFWDVYRSNFSLWSIAFPEQLRDILNAFVQSQKESGWFPQWPSPGHRGGMIGSHIDAVIADAVTKKIGGFDVVAAYEGIHRNAFENPPNGSVGRSGFDQYTKLGYVPAGKEAGYSVSCTLDYAYDDWCVAQVAKALGKQADYELLMARSKSYKTLWDPSVGFFRARRADGEWFGPFDEFAWSTGYVEGGPWQCTWAVQHDVDGLAELMGGRALTVAKLDRMMGLPPIFHVGEYKGVIHEMKEMANGGFGQYAHSNQPVHHVLYLYAALGQPERTEYWTRRVCQDLYNAGPSGFCGDEDNGEMSSWYVLSTCGLYQLCVGDPAYTLTSPLFDEVSITLPDQKRFTIKSVNNGLENFYVQRRVLDGQPMEGSMLQFGRIMQGGTLNVDLGLVPPTR